MDNESVENFEQMLESSFKKLDAAYEAGDSVTGKIVSRDDEFAYIDIGAKQEAIAELSEFSEDELTSKAEIQAYVVSFEGSRIKVSCRIGRGFTSHQILSMCYHDKQTVFGRISTENKAGYEVAIGETRAFCPKSQLQESTIEALKRENQGFIPFLIIELKKNNCVISHRALKDQETAELSTELQAKLKEGDRFSASVTLVEKFGIFVRLSNGLEGLVPRSELSLSRLVEPQAFSTGDEVSVEIMTLDWDNNKHAFSIKKTQKNPWDLIDSYNEGDAVTGVVSGMIKEGAFIEIEPGLEGLIHLSRMSKTKRVSKPEDILSKGQEVKCTLVSIDTKRKRLSLELVTGETDPWEDESVRANRKYQATAERSVNGGIIVRLSNGMDAFIPERELEKELPFYAPGTVFDIILTNIDSENRRASGSQKLVETFEESQDVEAFVRTESAAPATSSLGAMFGNVLSKVKEQVEDNDKT